MKRPLRTTLVPLCMMVGFLWSFAAHADDIPFVVRQASVWVHCGSRQGSGTVINSEKGYVLTNAHVVLNLTTNKPETCEVAFINDSSLKPTIFYDASWDRFVYDDTNNRDFAILKIGAPQQRERIPSFPFLMTDEFSKVGDPISVIAYPHTTDGTQVVTTGTISGLNAGIITTDAKISPGASGGSGVNADWHLIGISTRILLQEISPGVEQVVDYELVDLRAVLTWLDTFGTNMHDEYFTHADFARYHGPQTYVNIDTLSCTLLAKTTLSTTVYCLKPDGTRTVFPNDVTYFSWFGDFSATVTVSLEQLAGYRLVSNVTMKPGTLVKIDTDPKVYIVADALGTLRWIETEAQARQLFGDGWAGFVKDIPDTFFTNYHIGSPIQ